jgi:hypothetical protein
VVRRTPALLHGLAADAGLRVLALFDDARGRLQHISEAGHKLGGRARQAHHQGHAALGVEGQHAGRVGAHDDLAAEGVAVTVDHGGHQHLVAALVDDLGGLDGLRHGRRA